MVALRHDRVATAAVIHAWASDQGYTARASSRRIACKSSHVSRQWIELGSASASPHGDKA
jgi:hypothetical protein